MRDLAKEPEVARQALETMWTARRFEEAVDQLFARGLMHGHHAPLIGQEASAAGNVPLRCKPDRSDHLDAPRAQPLGFAKGAGT